MHCRERQQGAPARGRPGGPVRTAQPALRRAEDRHRLRRGVAGLPVAAAPARQRLHRPVLGVGLPQRRLPRRRRRRPRLRLPRAGPRRRPHVRGQDDSRRRWRAPARRVTGARGPGARAQQTLAPRGRRARPCQTSAACCTYPTRSVPPRAVSTRSSGRDSSCDSGQREIKRDDDPRLSLPRRRRNPRDVPLHDEAKTEVFECRRQGHPRPGPWTWSFVPEPPHAAGVSGLAAELGPAPGAARCAQLLRRAMGRVRPGRACLRPGPSRGLPPACPAVRPHPPRAVAVHRIGLPRPHPRRAQPHGHSALPSRTRHRPLELQQRHLLLGPPAGAELGRPSELGGVRIRRRLHPYGWAFRRMRRSSCPRTPTGRRACVRWRRAARPTTTGMARRSVREIVVHQHQGRARFVQSPSISVPRGSVVAGQDVHKVPVDGRGIAVAAVLADDHDVTA